MEIAEINWQCQRLVKCYIFVGGKNLRDPDQNPIHDSPPKPTQEAFNQFHRFICCSTWPSSPRCASNGAEVKNIMSLFYSCVWFAIDGSFQRQLTKEKDERKDLQFSEWNVLQSRPVPFLSFHCLFFILWLHTRPRTPSQSATGLAHLWPPRRSERKKE